MPRVDILCHYYLQELEGERGGEEKEERGKRRGEEKEEEERRRWLRYCYM